MSTIPNICTKTTDGYAQLLGHNWDTVQEAFKVRIPQQLAQRLEEGKAAAEERHEGQGSTFMFGGKLFQIWSKGSQGNKWVIENDDIQIHFKTAKQSCDWPVSVRYLSAGLWEYGYDSMRDYVVDLLEKECIPNVEEGGSVDDWCTLSRVDYAFDFYSPRFSHEMRFGTPKNNLLLTSGVKAGGVWTSSTDETITIGISKNAALQIQVYDKGKEITEKSGKFWMSKIWEREGFYPSEDEKFKDVWRVEVRFKKDFLKDRKIKTLKQLNERLGSLIAEALMRRRMVADEGGDPKHRERWPLHPLWAATYEASGAAGYYVPIGRQITMRRAEYIEMLKDQQAGIGRAISVAQLGHFSDRVAAATALKSVTRAMDDPEHENKTLKCVERQVFMDEAQ